MLTSSGLALVKPRKTNLITLQLRNEDAFDQRQSKAATGVSRSWQSTAEKRNDHNNDYIGHWPREKRKPHVEAVNWAYGKSAKFEEESQRHTNVRRLASFMISLTNLRSPATVAGGTKCSWISTSTFRKTILDVSKSVRCMLVFDGWIGSQDRVNISCFNGTRHRAHASHHLGIDLWFDIIICAVVCRDEFELSSPGDASQEGSQPQQNVSDVRFRQFCINAIITVCLLTIMDRFCPSGKRQEMEWETLHNAATTSSSTATLRLLAHAPSISGIKSL